MLSFLFFASLFLCNCVWADEIDKSAAWRALLHFPKNASTSLIDDPAFFLASQGKHNPTAELTATVQAFKQTPELAGDESPQCRFIGRYKWLERNAPDVAKDFVPQECPKWKNLLARVKPHSVTLVFPEGYLNSPASMFGHTMLRIDQVEPQPLRSFAINYAAETDEQNGIIYTFNGLSGRYKGFFSLMPYPEKLQEYQFGEQRDIWEYKLKLNADETEAMLEHIWELQNISTAYYFFDRNCSYQLLSLIEAVRPELDLLNGWGLSVMPIDTIRRLKDSELVGQSNLRPSQATQINQKLKLLSDEEAGIIKDLGNPDIDIHGISLPVDMIQRTLVLEAATDYVQWQKSRKSITLEQYRVRFLYLLSQRSQIKTVKTGAATPDSFDVKDPLQGHGSSKFALSYIQQGSNQDFGFVYRPAFHDVRDRGIGYRNGAGISFLEVNGRWDSKKDQLKIDSFDLLKIESLVHRNTLLKPYSWRINVGAKRADSLNMISPLQAFVSGGAGLSYRLKQGQWIVFGTAEALISEDKTNSKTFADLGWRVGAQWRPNDQIGITFTAHDWFNIRPNTNNDNLMQMDFAYYITKDQSIHYQRKESLASNYKEPIQSLSWNWFY